MVKEVVVVIDSYPTEGFFLAGSTVSGKVTVKTGSSKKYYNKVQLSLVGTIESDFSDRENGTRCTYSEEFVRKTITVWEKNEVNKKFPKGTTHLPFTLPIPSTSVIPSCQNNQTTVRYALVANITKNKRGKSDSGASTSLVVQPPVNVSDPDLQGPESVQDVKHLKSCFCFSAGSIEAEIRLRHKIYQINEVMEVEVEIDNSTRKRIDNFDVALMQKIICCGTPKYRFGRDSSTLLLYGEEVALVGDRATGKSVIARSSWAESIIIRVPPTAPSFVSNDSILNIEHYILLRVHVSRDVIVVKCPVKIGNYRPQDSNQQLEPSDLSDVANNPPSYFDILQYPSAAGGLEPPTDSNLITDVQPSAPPPPSDSHVDNY